MRHKKHPSYMHIMVILRKKYGFEHFQAM